MSDISCLRNGYKMAKTWRLSKQIAQEQQMEINNEIYVIDSSDDEFPNDDGCSLSVEKINDIIIGGVDLNKDINFTTGDTDDSNHESFKERKEETGDEHVVYISDDSSDSEDNGVSNALNINYNHLIDKAARSTNYNHNYEISDKVISKVSNIENNNLISIIDEDCSVTEKPDIDNYNTKQNAKLKNLQNCSSSRSTTCSINNDSNGLLNKKSTVDDEQILDSRLKLLQEGSIEDNIPSVNITTDNFQNKRKLSTENIVKATNSVAKDSNADKNCVKKDEISNTLSAQLHQFECFEKNAIKLCNSYEMCKNWEQSKMFVEISKEEIDKDQKMIKFESPNKLMDTSVRLRTSSGTPCPNNILYEQTSSSNKDKQLVTHNSMSDPEKHDEQDIKNDIFDYLKLDKRRPMENRSDLENENKNKKRRSLRVERQKQIQENAKELLKLRKENEAFEAGECPNDLINETIITVNNKHTCNDKPPVLEPISPELRLNNLKNSPISDLRIFNNTSQCELPSNISVNNKKKLLLSKRKYKSSIDTNKNFKLPNSQDKRNFSENFVANISQATKSIKLSLRSDDSDDSESNSSRTQKPVLDKQIIPKTTIQEKCINNLDLGNNIRPHVRLKRLQSGNNIPVDSKELEKSKEKNEINDTSLLSNRNFGSLEIFDKFSNKVYCDILQQSPCLSSTFDNGLINDTESNSSKDNDNFIENSGKKTIPTKVVDLSGEIKLTTTFNNEGGFRRLRERSQTTSNGISSNGHNHETEKVSSCEKMPRLKKMVHKPKELKASYVFHNKHDLLKYINNKKNNKLQISSTTLIENDNKKLSSTETDSGNISKFSNKFYDDICSDTNKTSDIESLCYVENNKEDEIESFFIKNEIVIIVRKKTVHFYEHCTGFKFFRSPKLWHHKGFLTRYQNDPEKRLDQLTNQIMYSDKITAYVEVLVRPRKLSSSHDCPVCEMSAVVYRNRSTKDYPERSILHLDYAQCSVNKLCFTVLPSDRAVVVGFTNTSSDKPLFILKKYLMPKQYSSNNDIITLPSVDFRCTNLQAVNADIILGYNTEKIVFWHHGYETILKIVNLTSISKSIFSPEKFSTQCVWARMDSCGSKGSALHILIFHPARNRFSLLTATDQSWIDFKVIHVYQLEVFMGSLKSVSIGGYRVVAAFTEGAISYEFPYEMQEYNLKEFSKAFNVCTYEPSTIYPSGENVVYYKNNTAVPLCIDQL
ncbi:putative uncharacterized protein DDB_G0291812 isoform X3 [Ctenocephalides felis]|uniref:putative uncharacterized protein DDB_G0291812 isoform X3 n=1 Tax=Ctenocephalides felis TaxID=7515 RepID=UPI000E6E470A|nr:putative uncharacterized protein DDB_G0291812 isoform X3 [Ctenocephalides felis]